MTKSRLLVLFVAFAFFVWIGQKDGFDALRIAWLLAGLLFWFATYAVLKLKLLINDWLRWLLATVTLAGLFSCLWLSTGDRIRWVTIVTATLFAFMHVVSSSVTWPSVPPPSDGGGRDAQGSCPPNTPQQPASAPSGARG